MVSQAGRTAFWHCLAAGNASIVRIFLVDAPALQPFEHADLFERAELCCARHFAMILERRLGMGPGSIGPAITVMQPDGVDDEKIWRKFGETRASPTVVPLHAATQARLTVAGLVCVAVWRAFAYHSWTPCMCAPGPPPARANACAMYVCGLNKGEELWHSLEVNQFGNKRNDEKEEDGEVEQEDQGETIRLRHT